MHPSSFFSAAQILWTLTFASQLVLLVVLLGRDRAKRFPWFTTAISLTALRILALKLLSGRMPTLTLDAIFIVMADLSAIVAVLVVVEMGRRAFAPVRRMTWLAGALGILLPALVVLVAWGPWPPLQSLAAGSYLANLRLMQLGAQKLDMLVDLLTVELGLLVVLLGRRYGAGWRSHTQRIVIGLSTASCTQLAVQAIWQFIARSATPHSQAEYDRIMGLRDKMFNANGAIYIAIVIWWIACLWMDEPGANAADPPHGLSPKPEYVLTEDAEAAEQAANAEPVDTPGEAEPEP
ncbi:MAG: hypothetical protein ACLPY1_12675 [Terracidiphilus sp.]